MICDCYKEPVCGLVLFRNMYCVWRAYLEGTVKVTQSRISACDNYKVQVADLAKTARLQKEQQLRKVTQGDATAFTSGNSCVNKM